MDPLYLHNLLGNPIETAIAAGLPAFAWAMVGVTAGQRVRQKAVIAIGPKLRVERFHPLLR